MNQMKRATSTSCDNNIKTHDTGVVQKRDDLRRTLMLVSQQQYGGQKLLRLKDNDAVPAFVNMSTDTDTINFEELTVMEDDLDIDNNILLGEYEKSLHRRAIFSEAIPDRNSNSIGTIPPSQRVDNGESKIGLLSTTPESKSFVTNKMITQNQYRNADEFKQREFVVVNDLHEKLNHDDSIQKVRSPRRGVKPLRAAKQRALSNIRNDNMEKLDQWTQIKKEITVLPHTTKCAKSNEIVYQYTPMQSTDVSRTNEGATPDSHEGILLRTHSASESYDPDETLHAQSSISFRYGRKATGRSLISMGSKESSMNSLLSLSVEGVPQPVIRPTESVGFQSIVSTGSTAHELDCIIAAPTILLHSSTKSSLDPVPETKASFVPARVEQKSLNSEVYTRPSNPMAIALLQYSTSIATVDSSRMSIVSLTSMSSPPPNIMPNSANQPTTHSTFVSHCTTSFHQYHHHHQHYASRTLNGYQNGERRSFNAEPILPSRPVPQGIFYLVPEPMIVDNYRVDSSQAFGLYSK